MAMSINELIAHKPSSPYIEDNPAGYSIWNLSHNDGLVYQESDRFLVAQVSFCQVKNSFLVILIYFLHMEGYRLHTKSIVNWNTGNPVSSEEKALIIKSPPFLSSCPFSRSN